MFIMTPAPRLLNQIYTSDSLLNLWLTSGGHWDLLERECLAERHSEESQANICCTRKTYSLEVLFTVLLLGFALWIWSSHLVQPSTMKVNTPQADSRSERVHFTDASEVALLSE
jgi:hypothetical protein